MVRIGVKSLSCPHRDSGLSYQVDQFKKNVKTAYEVVRNPGLDLISVLLEKIERGGLIKNSKYLPGGIDTTFIEFDNHVYVLTDGYLEYRDKAINPQYHFGEDDIRRIRNFCVQNGVSPVEALKLDSTLGLPASSGRNNRFVTLHILETHERGNDTYYNTFSQPDGIRDNQILEAVWKRWAKDSGFKDLIWLKY